jgi:hypothetical protein
MATNALIRSVWPKAMDQSAKGHMFAVDRARLLIRDRSELVGTLAATKSQVTVITEDIVDANIRMLEAQLAEHSGDRSSALEAGAPEGTARAAR